MNRLTEATNKTKDINRPIPFRTESFRSVCDLVRRIGIENALEACVSPNPADELAKKRLLDMVLDADREKCVATNLSKGKKKKMMPVVTLVVVKGIVVGWTVAQSKKTGSNIISKHVLTDLYNIQRYGS